MSNIRPTADQIIAVCIALLGGWLIWIAEGFPKGADIFPRFVLVSLLLSSAMLFASGFFRQRMQRRAEPRWLVNRLRPFARPLVTFLLCVFYVALVGLVGFFSGTIIFGVGIMIYLGARRPVVIVCSLLGLLIFVWLLFVVNLHVPLPSGILF
jgi:uncharacterized membrane protein (DUF485 family)